MSEVAIIDIDFAKRVFQSQGAQDDGSVVFHKKLSRCRVLVFLADHGQSLAGCNGGRCKGVAQVVDPDVLDTCAGPDTLSERLQVAERLAGQAAGDDPWVAVDAKGSVQVFNRRSTDMHDFLAGFGIGQTQGALVEIDVVPFKRISACLWRSFMRFKCFILTGLLM